LRRDAALDQRREPGDIGYGGVESRACACFTPARFASASAVEDSEYRTARAGRRDGRRAFRLSAISAMRARFRRRDEQVRAGRRRQRDRRR
jgi:hypothetical protein